MTEKVLIGALVAAVYALAEVVKWFVKQRNTKNGNGPRAKLDDEVGRQIRETYECSRDLSREIDRMSNNQEKVTEHLANISRYQERTAEALEDAIDVLRELKKKEEIREALDALREKRA